MRFSRLKATRLRVAMFIARRILGVPVDVCPSYFMRLKPLASA